MRNDGLNLPESQTAQLELAARAFRQSCAASVSPERLRAFLKATQTVDASAALRLRWLAITMDSADFEPGWPGLRTIYQAAAAAADPANAQVLHSWGISARNWAEVWMTVDLSERTAIAWGAEQALHAALELTPGDSRIAHSLGLLYYGFPTRSEDAEQYLSQAADWFSRAVAWDAGNAIAQLYVAHCCHDRQDWVRAVAEYDRVNLADLARDWPMWRAVKCREQLAMCHACAGNRAEAVRRFTALLDEIEAWDDSQVEERVINVDELVQTVTDVLDEPELQRRTRLLVGRLRLESRYQRG